MDIKSEAIARFMIAAPHSGSGKTSLTCGLLRLLQRRGLDIASFKCGPDYIDPMFHRRVLGINSINLDTYFTGEAGTRSLFVKHAAGRDVAVVEGVMGFFDGLAGTETTASSYDLARVTDTPVILVVDTKGMSRSVVPLIKGFLEYVPESSAEQCRPLIHGVILNRMSGMLYPKIKALIEKELPVRVLGYVPVTDKAGFGSRHLGLMQADEIADFQAKIDSLADVLSETLDIEGVLELAGEAQPLDKETCSRLSVCGEKKPTASEGSDIRPRCRIGVARDEAFTFYYADNLALLEEYGAEIVPFSPLRDKMLPDVDGLLFGGGYPELHTQELEANVTMRAAIKAAAEAGMPILAECGGFMYLQEGLRLKDGKTYKMCGAIPGETAMTEKLVRFGYMELTAAPAESRVGREAAGEEARGVGREAAGEEPRSACPYLPLGEKIRGHEFHYFDSTHNGDSCVAEKPVTGRSWPAVVCRGNLMAGFPHLYYASDPAFARRFVEACCQFSAC